MGPGDWTTRLPRSRTHRRHRLVRARDYDTETGQFLTVDPLDGVAGTTTFANPYHYANNDPISHGDPSGLQATDCQLGTNCGSFSFAGPVGVRGLQALSDLARTKPPVSTSRVWTSIGRWAPVLGPTVVLTPIIVGPLTDFVNDTFDEVSDALNPGPGEHPEPERTPKVKPSPGIGGGSSRNTPRTDPVTGSTQTLYHGSKYFHGSEFDLRMGGTLTRPATGAPGVYLTDDAARAIQQFAGPRGTVIRTRAPTALPMQSDSVNHTVGPSTS